MMMSPDSYYEFHLSDKSEAELLSEIRRLKREMNRLKNTMEHPDYANHVVVCPSEATQLNCLREYLQKAKLALSDIGASYIPTKTEIKQQEFVSKIGDIKEIVFSIGGYCSGWSTYTITIADSELIATVQERGSDPLPFSIENENGDPLSVEELWQIIKDLHIEEWKTNYTLRRFGYEVLDGTQWELILSYDRKRNFHKVYGDNSYPYNFDEFLSCFGIEFVK